MMSLKFSDIAILNIKHCDFGCIISGISKNEAIILTFGGIDIGKIKFYRNRIG